MGDMVLCVPDPLRASGMLPILSTVTGFSHCLDCRELPCPRSRPFLGQPTGINGWLATFVQHKARLKGHSSSEQPARWDQISS